MKFKQKNAHGIVDLPVEWANVHGTAILMVVWANGHGIGTLRESHNIVRDPLRGLAGCVQFVNNEC